jgi:flagellar protein FlgJ
MSVADDAHAFAHAIQDAGYATDPSYARKLISLMDRYDLYRFDS